MGRGPCEASRSSRQGSSASSSAVTADVSKGTFDLAAAAHATSRIISSRSDGMSADAGRKRATVCFLRVLTRTAADLGGDDVLAIVCVCVGWESCETRAARRVRAGLRVRRARRDMAVCWSSAQNCAARNPTVSFSGEKIVHRR